MPCYVIRAGDTAMVKIGWAEDPEQRCQALQTAHYATLQIIRVIDGPSVLERWLHSHYRSHAVRGEWFRFCPTMLTIEIGSVTPIPRTPTVSTFATDKQAELLAEIEVFLPQRNIKETTFGRFAVNDGKFVARLRRGDNMTLATLEKARSFIRDSLAGAA